MPGASARNSAAPAGAGLPAVEPMALAPHHLRLFALIIDYLLAVSIIKIVEQAALGAEWDLRPVAADGSSLSLLWVASLAVLIVVKDGLGGRSLGKWFTGTAVRRLHALDTVPALWRLCLRNVTLAVLPLDGALMFVDPFCRRIGDRLAGTVVLAPPGAPPITRRLLLLSAFFMALLLASLVITPWNLRRSAAYRTAVELARQDARVQAAAGAALGFGRSPELQLALTPEGGEAVVRLAAQGAAGTAQVTVRLALDRARGRWRLLTLEIAQPDAVRGVEQTPAPPR
ncbi:MAG: RDD family protein [Candidatus Lambdaproteobacteria bacterium]|nr:RDD family protein [Candidatus Lambdaproteobacteria bacterium]